MNRWIRLFLLSLVMSLALVAGTITAQDDIKILRFAAGPGDPRSIDPQQAIDTRDWYLLNVMFPALTTLDEESGQVEPGIVTGWDVSDDGMVYTFHIIEGVPWVRYNADTEAVEQALDENGDPHILTAHDVVFGWMRALDPATGSFASFMLAPLIEGGQAFNNGEGAAEDVGIRAIDDFTFEVTAPQSVGYALNLYGLINARPTPAWAIAESGDLWTEPENINTYGPFALKDWVHDESMTFIKNPFWPGSDGYGQAKLDELVMRFLDAGVALREYEAGNLDVVNVPSDQLARVRVDPTLSNELTTTAGACTGAWGFHVEKAPFDNVHIRRAFSYAVDRQSLVDNVLQGGALPSRWFTPPSVNGAPSSDDTEIGVTYERVLGNQRRRDQHYAYV
jgi:oligopeptide transport system substrate-binding protein